MNAILDLQISKVGVSTKEKDGTIRRMCRVAFFTEFDDRVANSLGGKAGQVLRALRDHDLSDATIGLDAIAARCTIEVGDDRVTIPLLRGVRAKGREAKEESAPPVVKMFFDFPWNAEAWTFLGEHCTSEASVKFEAVQQEMALPTPIAEARKGRGRKKQAETTEENGASTEATH